MGVIVCALGLAVLLGWYEHWIPVMEVIPALPPMRRMTAFGFLVSGIGVFLLGVGRPRAAVVCAFVVMVGSGLACLEYALHVSFGIDQLLGPDYINPHDTYPGRMSPATALCFLLTSIGLLAISSRRTARYASALSGILASVVIAAGTVGVLSYVLKHAETNEWRLLTRMALHTATGFVLVGNGLLALTWRRNVAGKRAPEWLPWSLGLGLAVIVLGVWRALMVHEESEVPLLSGIIMGGGVLGALLVAVAIDQALKARQRSRELQEGKELMESVFEAPPETLLLLDRRGRIVRVNGRVEAMFGYAPHELLGAPGEILVPPELRERDREQRESYFVSPWPVQIDAGVDLRGRRKNGSNFPVEVSLGPVQSGGTKQVLAVVRDISERLQAQEQLRLSEERFRNIFEQGPLGLTMVRRDGRLLRVNPAFCRMLGYSEEEMTSMTPVDITHPDDRRLTANMIETLFTGEAFVHRKIEKRYVKKNGDLMWGSLSATAVRNGKGRPLFALGMVEDITERKRDEERLRNLTERLSLATRTASIGIWDWDLRTNLALWDDTIFEIAGMSKMVPLPYGEFARRVHPDDIAAVNTFLQRAIEGKARDSVEFRFIRPDGTVRHLSSAAGVVRDPQGRVIRVVGTAADMTARKEMEAQIEASREQMATSARLSALGMMAGGVAHEINNPLAIIHASAADLLYGINEEGAVPPAVVARNSKRILETADRIKRIINSMRRLAREGSQDPLRPAPLARIVEGTLEICKERFKHHSVDLRLPVVDAALLVSCRKVQIEQVLLNLLQNAFDAVMEHSGEKWIRLDVTVEDGWVALSVTDSGPGIPPDLRTKIMEPFFTTKEVGKGTGLGLSLSQSIVEEHGSKLELTDRGGHPCFSFRLALSRKEEHVCN